ncbi:hypothetical protein QRO11_19800 [Paracidovorax citrulli]|uniref:STAS domain-containing protein n=1 Tax=Paracidovorax citrulli TaxID=80869 RepID=UPI00088F1C1F|nr:STAS domain-containing protein [Paracidovorax citrulli]UMT86994.1 hypothetical protein FRC90_02290 [Paracidovorax citrulli]WIY34161.1 hypothetical protein QRO11_19800 [Paracidovorax citrulli]SDJ17731.1 hypothetical protein SAMN04489709_10262 [Paracidovorax citrulli]
MSKEESSRGLLSKVVRFVRNPTVNWNELDSIDEERESQYSKQMLKEMIERKRRNDFVRRREFDQLRKLRQREALHGQRSDDQTARPSFFHTSMTSPDDRAVTLKKIDEIEAQMSQQWWKSKQPAGASSPAGAAPTEPAPIGASDSTIAAHARAFAPTAPASLPAGLSEPGVQPLFSGESLSPATDFIAATVPQTFPGALSPEVSRPLAPPPLLTERAEPPPRAVPAYVAPEPPPYVHEPDLEEAAIRFANGDYAGAEAGLLEALARHENDEDLARQAEFWMALFDFYRATGDQARFEALAIDFAARFGRSAPLWFSMPELLGLQPPSAAAADEPAGGAPREFLWNAPSVLTAQSVAALQASVARASAPPWTFSWSRLMTIEEGAVPGLAQQFEQWADRTEAIVFKGVDALASLLEARTPSGDRSVPPDWWRLRMAALRLMGRPDEFELVALDYCVTYEVSPPSWAPPACSYCDDGGGAGGTADAAVPFDADAFSSGFGEPPSQPGGLEPSVAAAVLSGHIEGDATAVLEPLEAHLHAGVPFSIGCDRLVRVDFAAAGSVLNWTAAQQALGNVVHFTQVPRLVAVFFNVIGIQEHARVVPRQN